MNFEQPVELANEPTEVEGLLLQNQNGIAFKLLAREIENQEPTQGAFDEWIKRHASRLEEILKKRTDLISEYEKGREDEVLNEIQKLLEE